MSYSFKAVFKATGCLALVLVVSFALALGLAACGCDEDTDTDDGVTTTLDVDTDDSDSVIASAVVGKWYCKKIDENIEFTRGGEVLLTVDGNDLSEVVTYEVVAGEIIVHIMATKKPRTIQFSIDGNKLTTVDPKYGTLVYTRS